MLASLPALASTVVARQIGPPGGVRSNNPKDKIVEDNLRSTEIERVRRAATKHEGRPADHKFPAVKEDFERIQLVNNVLQESATGALDYGRVAEGAAEIKKRAARLGANLFPPTTGKQPAAHNPSAAQRGEDLKSLLAELDRAIHGFVSNPMFGNTKVVNVPDSSEARRDLERVVRLSSRVREVANKLKKQSK
ncbi:MAG: hypothetical protein H7Z38_17380 [Rubrivivax sp.]|nr:hypothetical protein [Pyrinomonadaceae bacterium]